MDHIQDLEPRCSKHWQRPGAPHWGNGLPGGLLLLALTTLPLHPGARGPGQHGSEVHSARRADDRRGDTGPAMPQGRGHTDSHSQSSPTLSDLPDPGLAPRPEKRGVVGRTQEGRGRSTLPWTWHIHFHVEISVIIPIRQTRELRATGERRPVSQGHPACIQSTSGGSSAPFRH